MLVHASRWTEVSIPAGPIEVRCDDAADHRVPRVSIPAGPIEVNMAVTDIYFRD